MRIGRKQFAVAAAVWGVILCSLTAAADVVSTDVNPGNGRTYKLVGRPDGAGYYRGTSWLDAQTQAVYLGGNLTSINDPAENAWVWATYSPYPSWDLWIGLNDLDTKGSFVWASGEPVVYQNWVSGQPSGGDVVLMWWAANAQWSDTAVNDYNDPFGVVKLNTNFVRHDWNKPAGGVYAAATNWTPGGSPAVKDGAYFNQAAAYTVTFGASTNAYNTVVEQGTVTFDLGGNTLAVNGAYVGKAGQTAALSVTNGTISSTYGAVGLESTSIATMTIGTNGVWNSSRTLFVGDSGTGTLNVNAGGRLTSNGARLGYTINGDGTVVVSGTSSVWDDTDIVHVGYDGRGTLRVEGGGIFSAPSGLILGESGGSGSLVVTGTGSSVTTGSGWSLGLSNGSMLVSAGATVDSGNSSVGWSGGKCAVTITDPGSLWTPGCLRVDGAGSAINVLNGARVSSTSYISIGDSWYSVCQANVAGSGSRLEFSNVDWLYVGSQGTGTLAVSNSGYVGGGSMSIAGSATASGIVAVSGPNSRLQLAGELDVGRSGGSGSLAVSNGATVTTGNQLVVGWDSGSTGAMQVDGPGSTVTINNQDLWVGDFGTGTLGITGGAAVIAGAGRVLVGANAGGVGSVSVADPGSLLHMPGSLLIGSAGTGVVTIRDGAKVEAWDVGVGQQGIGSLSLGSGGHLIADQGGLSVGYGTGGVGNVAVAGVGSRIDIQHGFLVVGDGGGGGSVAITSGGAITCQGDITIGNQQGATTGTVLVSGPNSALASTGGGLSIGRQTTGSLTIEKGGGRVQHMGPHRP
jgi:T5SS/PEP-CTERM-associated repeat protein